MKKKFGFDGTSYRSRTGEESPDAKANLCGDLTASFKVATHSAVKAAWAEGLVVPGEVDGRLVNVTPNGKVQKLKSSS